MKSFQNSFFSLSLLLLLGITNANADDEIDKFGFSIGSFITSQGLKVKFDTTANEDNTIIDFENDLGLDENETVFRLNGYYRFNPKHRIDFSYFDLSRNANRALNRTIEFGDEVFVIDTEVNTKFSTDIYKIAYTYSFIQNEKLDIGALVGAYVLDISASIKSTGSNRSEATSTTAPLPVIGIRGSYDITPKFKLNGSVEYFAIDLDDTYNGNLTDTMISAEYNVFKNTGIGLAYNKQRTDINIDNSPINLDIDWEYSGYMAYLSFTFP